MAAKWKEISAYTGRPIDEDMPTNAAGRGAVAGIGVGPDGEPGIHTKKKKKQARNEAENSRISIRNTRRDANNTAKDQQKAGDFSEDDLKRIEDLVQKETDHFIGLVDAELKQKEEDLIEI